MIPRRYLVIGVIGGLHPHAGIKSLDAHGGRTPLPVHSQKISRVGTKSNANQRCEPSANRGN
jgi:hypothetical protein